MAGAGDAVHAFVEGLVQDHADAGAGARRGKGKKKDKKRKGAEGFTGEDKPVGNADEASKEREQDDLFPAGLESLSRQNKTCTFR